MSEPQFITDNNGKRTGVILSLKDYEELMEDLHDLAVIAERKNEPRRPAEDVFKEIENESENV